MPPGRSSGTDVAPAALVDSHVHFHPRFEIDAFFDAASRNLDRAERELGLASETQSDGAATPPPARVLLLMETARLSLIEQLESDATGAWRIVELPEPGTAIVGRERHQPVVVVEGRQVVTAEGLELLAAPCAADLPAGAALTETIAAALRLGSTPILPWGVGKWWGARGRRIAALLESPDARRVLLGDNGGRLAIGWTPRLLTLGAQRGVAVLRGSDPLPMAAECDRVGSFGSLLMGPFDHRQPATALRQMLPTAVGNPRAFGRGAGPLQFLTRQLRAQIAKRLRGRRRR